MCDQYIFFLYSYSGESYAGIYVPTLVNTIRLMNQQGTATHINLKGFMVLSQYSVNIILPK